MSEFKFEVDDFVIWLRSTALLMQGTGIALAGIEENREHLPSAVADYDSASSCGRIRLWVNGRFDFEVQSLEDDKPLFYRHGEISNLNSPILANELNEFFKVLQSRI